MTRTLTTVPLDLPPLRAEPPDHWPENLDVLDRRLLTRSALLRRLLASRSRYDALLLNGSGRFDQFAAALVTRDPGHVPIVVDDCTWDVGSSVLDRLACRIGVRLLDDPGTTFCVLSSAETELFPHTWHVDPGRVAFTPFCHTLTSVQLDAPTSEDVDIFAGGDSMRDYRPLLEAARHIPRQFRLAVRSTPDDARPLPSNVHAGPVSPDEFFELTRRARIVVVPLRHDICRSAGQQTYLNAMALGKLVIVTDSPGVRDYVDDRVTGLIVRPGDASGLAAALAWALDPGNAEAINAIAARAREAARVRFSPLAHIEALLRVVALAVRRRLAVV
jgi:glycosyltransferase involved in cell wall biosynthesis